MKRMLTIAAAVALLIAPGTDLRAQEVRELSAEDMVIRVTPPELTLEVGKSTRLVAKVVDIGGRPIADAKVFFFSRARRAVRVTQDGEVTARRPGKFQVVVRAVLKGKRGPSATVKINIPHPAPAKVEFKDAANQVFVGTRVRMAAIVIDTAGMLRSDVDPELASNDVAVATIDRFGFVSAHAPGQATLIAKAEGLQAEHTVEVVANPVTALVLTASRDDARTGDVITFATTTSDAGGATVTNVPVSFAFRAAPDDTLGSGASGQIDASGRFVAEKPGLYTITATCGTARAEHTVRIGKRLKTKYEIKLVGQGEVLDTHTSDLWVWEGVDGRDYAVTGTWGANGDTHFWDVTDPSKIARIATVNVDARTVNDVKVSEDGRLCIISREGASNRKNGIVIIDVVDPKNPKIISTFTDELTGGVHNLFIYDKHVYALSAGRRYDIINIEDPTKPRRVGSYQVFEAGSSIHDVWVEDGLAYSSNWRHGVHVVDVGNGVAGGSPSKPVKVGNYAYPSGWNHAAFPYKSPETGKSYVVAGDEAFPYGLHVKNKPTYARGWLHFIDMSDMKNPKEVARFEVPEAGTHNLWIEGDILYAAFYNGGLRVIDISGDLMGDLYKQGREMAWYMPAHEKGYIPNAPMVWGPQPHKGHVFFSDWNSGLWAVKVEPQELRP